MKLDLESWNKPISKLQYPWKGALPLELRPITYTSICPWACGYKVAILLKVRDSFSWAHTREITWSQHPPSHRPKHVCAFSVLIPKWISSHWNFKRIKRISNQQYACLTFRPTFFLFYYHLYCFVELTRYTIDKLTVMFGFSFSKEAICSGFSEK